jgi:hypothetical protein
MLSIKSQAILYKILKFARTEMRKQIAIFRKPKTWKKSLLYNNLNCFLISSDTDIQEWTSKDIFMYYPKGTFVKPITSFS